MKKHRINKAKRFSGYYRNNGSCSWCNSARTYQARKAKQAARAQVLEYLSNSN